MTEPSSANRTLNMNRLDAECRRKGWRLCLETQDGEFTDLSVWSHDFKSTIDFVQITPYDRRRKPRTIEIAADMLLDRLNGQYRSYL